MAHVHGFFPGEFCLFEDLFEEKKRKDITRTILMWLNEGITVQIRSL